MISLSRLVSVLCTLLAILLPARSFGADVVVSPGESLATAIRRALPGDRVILRAGIYPGGGWIEQRGTATAPITVVSIDGPRRAVLEGGDESLRIGNGAAYLVFDGLEIRNAGNNVIHIDGGSHHITLRNIYAHDAGPNGDVLKVNQSHHIFVERSEFARPGPRDIPDNPYQECLDFVDVDDSVIRDNHFHDGGSMLLFVKGGSRNVVIERNVFSHQRPGASDPMVGLGGFTDASLLNGELYEATDIVFRNNILMNGVTGALGIYDADGAFIANNLFLDNDRVLVEFRAGNGPAAESRRIRVVNNLMVDTRGRMPEAYRLSSHGLRDFATSHNLFWNNGAPLPPCSLLDLSSQPGHLFANPLIVAPGALASRDAIVSTVRPAPGSPATDTGLDASGPPFGVVDDILGTPREGRFDRGPFVLSPPTPAPDAGRLDSGVPPSPSLDAGRTDATTPPPDSARDISSPDSPDAARTDSGPRTDGASSPPLDAARSTPDAGLAVRSPSQSESDAAMPGQLPLSDAGTSAASASGSRPRSRGCNTNSYGTVQNFETVLVAVLTLPVFRRKRKRTPRS